MGNLQSSIKNTIQKAEQLNDTKVVAIKELEGRLNTCPSQWLSATKNFIKIIRGNISIREKLANELKNKFIVNNPQRVIDITYELQALDNKDIKAADMYDAIMSEEV